jgi:hypothetical protein
MPLISASLTSRFILAGMPITRLRGGMIVPSVTTAPAATIDWDPIFTLFKSVTRIPIKE